MNGTLAPEEAEKVEAHLANCADCRAELRIRAQARGRLRRNPARYREWLGADAGADDGDRSAARASPSRLVAPTRSGRMGSGEPACGCGCGRARLHQREPKPTGRTAIPGAWRHSFGNPRQISSFSSLRQQAFLTCRRCSPQSMPGWSMARLQPAPIFFTWIRRTERSRLRSFGITRRSPLLSQSTGRRANEPMVHFSLFDRDRVACDASDGGG